MTLKKLNRILNRSEHFIDHHTEQIVRIQFVDGIYYVEYNEGNEVLTSKEMLKSIWFKALQNKNLKQLRR